MPDTIIISGDEEDSEKKKNPGGKKKYDIEKYLSLLNSSNKQWMKEDTYFKTHNQELSKEERWRQKAKDNILGITFDLFNGGLNDAPVIRELKKNVIKKDIIKPTITGLYNTVQKLQKNPLMGPQTSLFLEDKVEKLEKEEDTGKALVKEVLGGTFKAGYKGVKAILLIDSIPIVDAFVNDRLDKFADYLGDNVTDNSREIMGVEFKDGDVRRKSDKPTSADTATSNAYSFKKIDNKPLENYGDDFGGNRISHADIILGALSRLPISNPQNIPYDQYHVFPGKKQKTGKSTSALNQMPYDMYHTNLNWKKPELDSNTNKKNNSSSQDKDTYWIKETADGLVIRKPGQKEKIYKPKKPPILPLFQPWNPLGNNSIVPSHSNYNGKHSTGSHSGNKSSTRRKSRNLSKKEREKIAREAVHKSKTGEYMPFPTAVSPYANGGFVNKTTLSYVGEDGPEAIIPLGAKRRQRGLDLWNQAGAMLGVPGYANGAIVGANPGETVKKPKKNAVHKAGGNGKTSSGNKKSGVKVSVGNISINVKGSGDGGGKNVNLLQLLRAQKGQVSDELCSIIADAVEGAYKNIPVA
ncbi:hypothetical protein [Anaerostipes faecis]|uniref:hypothetical protein n=1 Tax=Anaerostipes faecis TaxID=2880702 RepID=UPI00265B1697|nr:hypothetical protein [Anaerostipes faecis]